MADVDESLTEWRPVPPVHVRRMKTQCEDELKTKLGSKKERTGIHPIIQSEVLQRAKTCCVIDYHPVSHTATHHVSKLPPTTKTYNPWRIESEAARQLLQSTRRGPRRIFFSVGKQQIVTNSKAIEEMWEKQKKRAEDEQDGKLESVFSSWRVLHSRSKAGNRKMGKGRRNLQERREQSAGLRRKLQSPIEDKQLIGGERDYLMQKLSYWRQIKRASVLMNTYARDVTRIPDASRTEVRIYISSTPDLVEEREMLASVTQPELERTLDKYGITCQFVDLRLGVNRLSVEADAVKIIQHEIDKCRRISFGPTFIGLIGNELDRSDIPHEIDSKVFESIREIILRDKLPYLELVDECYRLDSNNLPPMYFLQIDEYTSDILEENLDRDDIIERLAYVIREAMSIGLKSGVIDRTAVENLQLSVTQWELEQGFLRNPNPEKQALCVLIKEDKMTTRTNSTADVKETLKDFVEDICPENLIDINMKTKNMDYLKHLHETVLRWLIGVIENTIKEMDFDIRDHVGDISELLHHMHMSNALCHSFIGRDDILISFQQNLETRFNPQKPISVRGNRGSGKSAFMAKLARLFPEWSNNKCKVVVRFIGTSPESCQLFTLLVGLCHQICAMFNISTLEPEEKFSIRKLIGAWQNRMNSLSEFVSTDQPLVILLDSIDCVSNGDEQVKEVEWIPPMLPEGVFLIYSNQNQRVFEDADKRNSFSLTELGQQDVLDITKKSMRNENRKLTDDQLQILLDKLSEENSPMRLRVLLDNACMWPSTVLPQRDSFTSLETMFQNLVVRIENTLGRTFVKYSLCFLALAKYGITEKELAENLNRNDTLIRDSIAETVEDGSYLIGVPVQLNLSRLLILIKRFTQECKSDGQTIITLKTQELMNQILKRYNKEDFCISLHRDLAKYFMLQCRDFLLTGRSSSASHVFKINKLNIRMLRCVPYHLCQSHTMKTPTDEILKKQIFCNMHWFLCRVLSSPFPEVLADLESSLKTFEDRELETLYDLLKHAMNSLIHDPFHIFVVLVDGLSHILKHYGSLFVLAGQAHDCLKRTDLTQLLPKHKMCLNFGTVMKSMYSMVGMIRAITIDHRCIIIRGEYLALHIIDLSSGELEADLTKLIEHSTDNICIRSDTRGHIYISSGSRLSVWDSKHGVVLHSIPLDLPEASKMEIVSINSVVVQSNNRLTLIDAPNEKAVECALLQSVPVDWNLSANKQVLFTLHDTPRLTLDIWSLQTKKLVKRIPVSYMGKPLIHHPLLITDDGLYVVVCFEYKALVIDATRYEYVEDLGQENRCLCLSTLTRCSEHVILVDTMKTISIWKLRTGDEVCSFSSISPREHQFGDSRPDVTDVVVSEDDHFMFVGLSSGQFSVHHIPTQCTVMVIQAHCAAIQTLVFLTNARHFQHMLSCSIQGVIKLWNFQHILSDARKQLFPFILDDDLQNEEKQKINKRHYFGIYDMKRNNKMFLNGADVAVFFGIPPRGTFESIQESALRSHYQWITTRNLGQCRNVMLSTMGKVQPVLATSHKDVGIAIWDIHTATLTKLLVSMKQAENITQMMFMDEDRLITAISTTDDHKQSITVWDTETGECSLAQEKCLSCAMSDNPPRVFCIFSTSRRDQTLFKCWEVGRLGKCLSAYVQVPSTDVETSTAFLSNVHVNILLHRREKSTELRVLHMDSYEHCDVTARVPLVAQEGQSIEEKTADDHRLPLNASVRILKFPFPTLYAHLIGDCVFMLTEAEEIIQLNAIAGTVTKKVNLDSVFSMHQLSIASDGTTVSKNVYLRRTVISTSRDGTYLLLGCSHTVQIWSMQFRKKVCQFRVRPGEVMDIAISDDNSSVVTGTSLGSVQVWTAKTGALLCSFPALSPVDQVFIDRTGKQVVALVDETDERRVIILDVKEPLALLSEGT